LPVERSLDISPADGFALSWRRGASARVTAARLLVGGPALIRTRSIQVPKPSTAAAEAADKQAVILSREDQPGARALAAFVLAESPARSREAVRDCNEARNRSYAHGDPSGAELSRRSSASTSWFEDLPTESSEDRRAEAGG